MVRTKSKSVSIAFTALALAVLATCSDPDAVSGPAPPTPAPPAPRGPASIEVTARPGDMLVHEARVITVVVKDSTGNVLSDITPTFTSNDTSVAEVSSSGVVSARWPGVARIDVAVASLRASVYVRVVSRLRIGLDLMADWTGDIQLAVGDTVRLKPYVTDANGRILDIKPSVTWSSTNPAGISVDSNGMLKALEHGAAAEIRAVGPEGVGLKPVVVSVPASGPPATLRVAHAVAGLGPITFLPSKGSPRTVNPGEAATLQVPPGILLVQAQATTNPFNSYGSVDGVTIKAGEKVTLFVIGYPNVARLRWVWATSVAIPQNTAVVDVMQGTGTYPVIYIQPPGQPLTDPPANCYFDWTDIARWEGSPGSLELLLLGKYPDKNVREKLQVEAKGGMRNIVVLAGSLGNMSYFSFPDL